MAVHLKVFSYIYALIFHIIYDTMKFVKGRYKYGGIGRLKT